MTNAVSLPTLTLDRPDTLNATLHALSSEQGPFRYQCINVNPILLNAKRAAQELAQLLGRLSELHHFCFLKELRHDLEYEVWKVKRAVDILLIALTENQNIQLDSFSYGDFPASNPRVFVRFANAKLRNAMLHIDFTAFRQREAMAGTLQGIAYTDKLHLALSPTVPTQQLLLARALRQSLLRTFHVCGPLGTTRMDVSSIVSALPPSVRHLQCTNVWFASLSLLSTRTIQSLCLNHSRLPKTVLPFIGIQRLLIRKPESEFYNRPLTLRQMQALRQLVTNNYSTLQDLQLVGLTSNVLELILPVVLPQPIRGHAPLKRLSVSADGLLQELMENLFEPLPRACPSSVLTFLARFCILQVCLARCSYRSCATILMRPPFTYGTVPGTLLPSPLSYCCCKKWLFSRLLPRRQVLSAAKTTFPRALWAYLLATADDDSYPGPSVVSVLLRANVDSWV